MRRIALVLSLALACFTSIAVAQQSTETVTIDAP